MLLIAGMIAITGLAKAQTVRKDPQSGTAQAQIQPATRPVNNPNQIPNYYQNNSSYNNNSSQNNKQPTPDANSFPGNGNYTDPSRPAANNFFGGSYNPAPLQGPLNTTVNNNANAGTSR